MPYSTKSSPHLSRFLVGPWYPATVLADALQLPITQLNGIELDHTRIQAQCLPQVVLRLAGRVKPHDEVVTIVVLCLMLAYLLRQAENSPVLDPADGAPGAEDEGAGGASDSGRWVSTGEESRRRARTL